jgi:hypothetical protein
LLDLAERDKKNRDQKDEELQRLREKMKAE